MILLVVVVLPSHYTFASDNDFPPITVRFCAPQNDVYPFFITEKNLLTGINPDMMRQVFNAKRLPGITLEYVRRPWKRCNTDLETGEVDMMIGGFDASRTNVTYPSKLGFELDKSVISRAEVCFFSTNGEQMERARRGLEGKASFVVGIEAGFSKKHDANIRPRWVELFNPVEKYRMLEMGRVDAIVQVCAMDGVYPIETKAEFTGFTEFENLQPPYLSNPAYVVFSDQFAESNTALAKRIITLSLTINKDLVYERYKPAKVNKFLR